MSAIRAAIICPPIGQEYIRTHWALRQLAFQLARKGIHVLRMDYHGMGDSAGSIEQVESLHCWTQDIEQAIAHLQEVSGAANTMLIGQRFGACLAAEVARSSPTVNSLVLWEPIVDGQSYIDQLRKIHHQMLDLWVCKMETPNDDQIEEILGYQFSRSLVSEIEATKLNISSVIQPHLIVDTACSRNNYSHPEPSLQKVIRDERGSSWWDIRDLESAFLRPVTIRTIVGSIDFMFQRLESFEALSPERGLAGVL